jgi:hypothetical protein
MGSELRPHRLFWSPEAVAETALAWPSSRSITIGSAAATLQVAIAGAVMMGGVGEPHPTWASYLADAARAGVVFAILSVLIFLPTLVILLLVHWLDGSRSTLIRSMSVVGLSHLSILPLAVLWCPWGLFAQMAKPSFGFGPGAAGKPAWVESTFVALVGSPFWIVIGVALLLTMVFRANAAVTRRVARSPLRCRSCSYPLLGIDSDRCPECGEINDRASME